MRTSACSAGTFLTIYGSFTGHLEESRHAAAIVTPLLADPSVHIFRRIFAWAVTCWYTCNVSDYELGDRAVAAMQDIARDEGMHIAERFACILGYFLDMDRRDARRRPPQDRAFRGDHDPVAALRSRVAREHALVAWGVLRGSAADVAARSRKRYGCTAKPVRSRTSWSG